MKETQIEVRCRLAKDRVCRLISRNGNEFKSFPALASGLLTNSELALPSWTARFHAFDLLWCEGDDLRYLALIERKSRLRAVTPQRSVAYVPNSEPAWLKIRNTDYSPWAGREELFERIANDPNIALWNEYAMACAAAEAFE